MFVKPVNSQSTFSPQNGSSNRQSNKNNVFAGTKPFASRPFVGAKAPEVKPFAAKPFVSTKPFSGAKTNINPQAHTKEIQNAPTLIKKSLEESNLKIYPLGGQEEVGRNCTVFEYDEDIVILDMGLQFSDEDMPGIDYIIPNVSSLRGKEKNIRGVIFSHGHLDHIGAAPILLEQLGNPPIIGRQLTLAMIKHRQEDYKKGTTKNLKTISIQSIDQKIKLGKFDISFFAVEHSIIDAVGLIITTPHGTVIHPGDWLIEEDPLSGQAITYGHLASLPSPKILMLESLGVSYSKERTPARTTLAN